MITAAMTGVDEPWGLSGATAAPEAEVSPLPFERVYERHAGPVYRFCLSQTGNATTAEDVASDTFAAALAAYERVRPEEAGLRPWLFRIARNQAVDHRRRLGRTRRFLDRQGRQVAPELVEDAALLRAELREVVAAMGRLPGRDRQLLGLRLAAGLSFAEISAVTGMQEAAARVATHRALKRLRSLVAPPDLDGELP
jgi:RNA polymerase sigma-70 factor (ECF subfamily)